MPVAANAFINVNKNYGNLGMARSLNRPKPQRLKKIEPKAVVTQSITTTHSDARKRVNPFGHPQSPNSARKPPKGPPIPLPIPVSRKQTKRQAKADKSTCC